MSAKGRPQCCSILLAEDDSNDVLFIRHAFEKAGYGEWLSVVRDGEEAIAYLAGRGRYEDRQRYPPPNLFLLDIKMPRRSGVEVLEWLRQREEYRTLKVVVLTSSRQAFSFRRVQELGASYLVKPIAQDAIVQLVKNYCSAA